MGTTLQVADLFLRCRRVLEHGWRGALRIHDQPADCVVLHAEEHQTQPQHAIYAEQRSMAVIRRGR